MEIFLPQNIAKASEPFTADVQTVEN